VAPFLGLREGLPSHNVSSQLTNCRWTAIRDQQARRRACEACARARTGVARLGRHRSDAECRSRIDGSTPRPHDRALNATTRQRLAESWPSYAETCPIGALGLKPDRRTSEIERNSRQQVFWLQIQWRSLSRVSRSPNLPRVCMTRQSNARSAEGFLNR